MSTPWTLEGTDLRTLAFNIGSTSGWDAFPSKRSGDLEIAFMDAVLTDPRKWIQAREIPLELEMFRTNASGGVPAGGAAEALRTNIDTLLGLLYKRNGYLDLRQTVPTVGGGTHARSAQVEVNDFIPLEEDKKMLRKALINFKMVEGLWRQIETAGGGVPQKTAGKTGITAATDNFNVITGGNAPVRGGVLGAFTVEFIATAGITNPRFEVLATGEFVQYSGSLTAGQSIVFDVGRKTAVIDGTIDAGGGITKAHAWWLDLDPASTTQIDVSVSVASNFDVEVLWYDRWF